jgi:hypothetical protein
MASVLGGYQPQQPQPPQAPDLDQIPF